MRDTVGEMPADARQLPRWNADWRGGNAETITIEINSLWSDPKIFTEKISDAV